MKTIPPAFICQMSPSEEKLELADWPLAAPGQLKDKLRRGFKF
jgi:hypothetical protein